MSAGSLNRRASRPTAHLTLAVGLLLACGSKAPSGPPNIVVITLDTFRADRLGALSGGKLTPNLDRLASEATRFTQAVTPIGTTHPAHASLFTGLYPTEHGVRFNGRKLGSQVVTLAERLQAAGYHTAALVSKRLMLTRGGLDQGFDLRSDIEPGERPRIRPGAEVNELALDWAGHCRERSPYFLWVHYFEPHTPYQPTPHFEEQVGGYDGPLRDGASVGLFYDWGGPELPATDENLHAMRALYDGHVLDVDARVGELLTLLEEGGCLEPAVIVVAADHGQLLGEHGEGGHGYSLREPVLRVPLLVWTSWERSPRAVEERVSLVDIAPTLLELARLPGFEGASGRSLVPALEGGALERRPYFAIVRVPKRGNDAPDQKQVSGQAAVYEGSYKLVLRKQGDLVFDLARDPGEMHPLDSHEAQRLAERLRPLAASRFDPDAVEVPVGPLPPDVEAELRALGYLGEPEEDASR
jgi:arylsulfatase A-like enzyme